MHQPHDPTDDKKKNKDESPGPATYVRPREFDVIPEVGEDGEDEFNVPKFN